MNDQVVSIGIVAGDFGDLSHHSFATWFPIDLDDDVALGRDPLVECQLNPRRRRQVKSAGERFVAFDTKTGETVWERGGEYPDLRAVNRKGTMQAWQANGKLELTFLPAEKRVLIEALSDSDVRITPNGNWAVCLPRLKTISLSGKSD